jgi:ferredoxin
MSKFKISFNSDDIDDDTINDIDELNDIDTATSDSEKSYDKHKIIQKKKYKRHVKVINMEKVLGNLGWILYICDYCKITFDDVKSEYFSCSCNKIFCGVCVDKCKFKIMGNNSDWSHGSQLELNRFDFGNIELTQCGYCSTSPEKYKFSSNKEKCMTAIGEKNHGLINNKIQYLGDIDLTKELCGKICQLDGNMLRGSAKLIYTLCIKNNNYQNIAKVEHDYAESIKKELNTANEFLNINLLDKKK